MNTTPGYADPDTAFFRALHSTKGQNWNSWSVPELDALLEEGRRTMDQKKRKEIYDRVQIMILENVPHLWLFSADTIDFTQAAVKGFSQHPTDAAVRLRGRLARQGVTRANDAGVMRGSDRRPIRCDSSAGFAAQSDVRGGLGGRRARWGATSPSGCTRWP